MEKLWAGFMEFMRDEEGATAVEYGVMIALIIAVAVAIIAILGGQVRDGFQSVSDALTGAGIAPPAG